MAYRSQFLAPHNRARLGIKRIEARLGSRSGSAGERSIATASGSMSTTASLPPTSARSTTDGSGKGGARKGCCLPTPSA